MFWAALIIATISFWISDPRLLVQLIMNVGEPYDAQTPVVSNWIFARLGLGLVGEVVALILVVIAVAQHWW